MVRRVQGPGPEIPADTRSSTAARPESLAALFPWGDGARAVRADSPFAWERDARFLARLIEVAARDRPVELRLAHVLDLATSAGGAVDVAAAIAERDHLALVVRAAPGDTGDGDLREMLGAWLEGDGAPPGTMRAAAVSADGSRHATAARPHRNVACIEVSPRIPRRAPAGSRNAGARAARLVVPPGHPRVAMAFAVRSSRAAGDLERRFPPSLSRPVASVIASLSVQWARERELHALQRAEAEQRRFVTVVAHELRTPLTSLAGYLDLAAGAPGGDAAPRQGTAPQDAREPADRQAFLDRARDLVDGMATLVADLLEISRLDAGQLHLSPAPCSGAEVAQAALHDVTPLAMARGIALEAALAPRLRTVYADRQRVHQILVNLLANAIKFAPAASRVGLSLRFAGSVAIFAVRDRGPGIAPEERSLIFEPFHRAAGAERVAGTGLGLPIARDLAQRMGGALDVASVVGKGSTFLVALPAIDSVGHDSVAAALREATEQAEADIVAQA
ncbi:MAG: sensor histidine kinase [Candidatus Limnocylindrales bacterium]